MKLTYLAKKFLKDQANKIASKQDNLYEGWETWEDCKYGDEIYDINVFDDEKGNLKADVYRVEIDSEGLRSTNTNEWVTLLIKETNKMTIQKAKQILALRKIEKRRKDEVMRFMTTGKIYSDELQKEIDEIRNHKYSWKPKGVSNESI
tara:strand:- start:802 stop:1245 length:444 start_codon:yes stop_codon:yes gene_type:complete